MTSRRGHVRHLGTDRYECAWIDDGRRVSRTVRAESIDAARDWLARKLADVWGAAASAEPGTPDRSIEWLMDRLRNTGKPMRGNVRSAIRQHRLLGDTCSRCGQGNVWNGKPLVLQIDHENGDNGDHRPENLRLLCPNCHTQTPTWGRQSTSAA